MGDDAEVVGGAGFRGVVQGEEGLEESVRWVFGKVACHAGVDEEEPDEVDEGEAVLYREKLEGLREVGCEVR